jgi:hypothetical protein
VWCHLPSKSAIKIVFKHLSSILNGKLTFSWTFYCSNYIRTSMNSIIVLIVWLFQDRTQLDLGIIFDRKITFDLHMNYMISRSLFLKRFGREFSDPYVLKIIIYCSVVRSVLEYGSSIWSPNFEINKGRIESVQRNFLRFALRNLDWAVPLHSLTYRDRCMLLNLNTLDSRWDAFFVMLIRDVTDWLIFLLFIHFVINFPYSCLFIYQFIYMFQIQVPSSLFQTFHITLKS